MTQPEHTLTRRAYLTMAIMLGDQVPINELQEAVASTALSHPEWDLDERKTLEQWQAEYAGEQA